MDGRSKNVRSAGWPGTAVPPSVVDLRAERAMRRLRGVLSPVLDAWARLDAELERMGTPAAGRVAVRRAMLDTLTRTITSGR